MPIAGLLLLTGVLAGVFYGLGRRRSRESGTGFYAGAYGALWSAVPALALAGLWLIGERAVLPAIFLEDLSRLLPGYDRDALRILAARISAGDGSAGDGSAGDESAGDGSALAAGLDVAEAAAADAARLGLSRGLLTGASLLLSLAGGGFALARIAGGVRARPAVEQALRVFMMSCAALAVVITGGIILSLIFETIRFFTLVSPGAFLFGLDWSPQTALRADQIGASGSFGAIPVFAGTLMITILAIGIAAPVGLLSAIYMSEYASRRLREIVKPLLEILAGIPTVVYGFFAALTAAPLIRDLAAELGLAASSESALAAGVVMGIMIIPFISSLSDDVIAAVPGDLREGSYALGATRSETIRKVVLPAAMPGIASAFLLAISRAIGETMIVVMAAGLAANMTANPLEAVTTVTVQIVTLLVGDQEFDSAKTLAAFALGMMLFLITLALNAAALITVRRYRERYE